MTYAIGLDPAAAYTAADLNQGRGAGLGDRVTDHAGNEFVFVVAGSGGFSAEGYVLSIDETFSAVQITTANAARGDAVGVTKAAIPAGGYGWAQVKGIANVQVLASAAANVRLNTTVTAGAADDDGTTSSKQIQGLYLTAARAASAGTAPGILNYPFVDVTI